MISAVLVCLNEPENIERCLKSLEGFAKEIIVVDLDSTDDSRSVVSKYGAKIFRHPFSPIVEKVRNFAISKANGDWILVLDPDEVIGNELKNRLEKIADENKFVAVNIPRKNIFFGSWIRHTNWWPDRHIRFFKKGSVRWKNRIHSYPEVKGEILNLDADEDLALSHFSYSSISEFVRRQNRYSDIESENLFESGVKFSWFLFLWKPLREFLVRYIRHAGFLDGFYGFALTVLMMVYQLQVMIKLWELERQNK